MAGDTITIGEATVTDENSNLSQSEGRHAELEMSLENLADSAQRILTTPGRLRSLLKANRAVTDEIELEMVLRTIVEVAVDLVGARYGAVGVVGPDGLLEQFIHVGMPDDLVARIGQLPEGHGLLGALIVEQQPIRLPDIATDPRSSGFPNGHPPMKSFLGVPVRVRGETFGNLYLAERNGGEFTAEDEELLVALAATAGAAIDHARLFDENQRRQRWTAASAEVTAALLSEEGEESLAVLADRVAGLADADLVCVVVRHSATQLRVDVARGKRAAPFAGTIFDATGTLAGRAEASGDPLLAELGDLADPLAIGPTMALPITPSGEPAGVLIVSRATGRPRFSTADLDMAADFAAQASVALRLASARADRQQLAVLEDRGRIARELHDNVIQRLFGAGLSLQAISGSTDAKIQVRIVEQVDSLDAAIADIRTAIFTMTTPQNADRPKLRHRVIDLLAELASSFPQVPHLAFAGPVDLMVAPAAADDVVAVVREGLSNIARHAHATHAWISISVAAGRVSVEVEDDGRGIRADSGMASGTANLAARAAAWSGSYELVSRRPTGTILRWSAPLEAAA